MHAAIRRQQAFDQAQAVGHAGSAGQGKANPIACILSFAMALRYSFDAGAEADRLEAAVETVLANGLRTADLVGPDGGKAVSTSEMGDAIVAALDG